MPYQKANDILNTKTILAADFKVCFFVKNLWSLSFHWDIYRMLAMNNNGLPVFMWKAILLPLGFP